MASLASVSNGRLLRALHELVVRDRQTEAELLRVLGEVDVRRLYLEQGCSSMYAYCTEILHMSEGVAFHRIKVARAGRRFPALLERMRTGELHLSGAELIAAKLTAENQLELLDQARHKSKRAIEELLADRAPKPDAPSLLRKMPDPAPARDLRPSLTALAPSPTAPPTLIPRPRVHPPTRPPEPLGEQRYKVQFTASRELCDKLREAQALLRHQVPDGDLAEIFSRALTLLVKEAKKKKFAEVDRPRRERTSTEDRRTTRHIPAQVRRAVQARDKGRCAFVGSNGRRCGSRDFLEFHHTEPWAHSRRHAASNIELRCRAHNQHSAVQDFGPDYMARFGRSNGCELSPGTVEAGGNQPDRTD
jgi:hypothetical protein